MDSGYASMVVFSGSLSYVEVWVAIEAPATCHLWQRCWMVLIPWAGLSLMVWVWVLGQACLRQLGSVSACAFEPWKPCACHVQTHGPRPRLNKCASDFG